MASSSGPYPQECGRDRGTWCDRLSGHGDVFLGAENREVPVGADVVILLVGHGRSPSWLAVVDRANRRRGDVR